MIRAVFFAFGVFVALCGVAAVLVDRVVLTDYAGRRLRGTVGEVARNDPNAWRLIYAADARGESDETREVIDPPDWAGFGLLSIGAVTLLYSVSLPGRRQDADEDHDD